MGFFQGRQQIVEHTWLLNPGTFIALVALIEPVQIALRSRLLTCPSILSLFHSYLSFLFLCEAAPSSLTSLPVISLWKSPYRAQNNYMRQSSLFNYEFLIDSDGEEKLDTCTGDIKVTCLYSFPLITFRSPQNILWPFQMMWIIKTRFYSGL